MKYNPAKKLYLHIRCPALFCLKAYGKFWRTALIAAALCLLFAPATARAVDADVENVYYTVSNQERYTLIHEVKVDNSGTESAYDIDLRLPLMDNGTPPYSRKVREQLDPWPDRIAADERGRRVAYYHVDELPAGTALVFTHKYVVDVADIIYDYAIMNSSGGYDALMESLYLLPSPGIESDHAEIIAFARQAAAGKTNPYDVAKNAFAAVNLYMSYEQDDLNYGGALRALRRKKGVCEDYSSLYVAVLRALGIAARQQGGYLYLPGEHIGPPYVDEKNDRLNLKQMRHTWVEFLIPGHGWVTADPTFNYSFDLGGVLTKFPNWRYFAEVTGDRRYLSFREGSVEEDEGMLWVYKPTNGMRVELIGIDGYLLPGSQAAYYNDLPGHWAEQAIMRLSEREEPLLQGMGNGIFGVDGPMTRAQLVTCLQRLLKSPAAAPKFTDLPPAHWAYRDIGAAQQAGWISGYPDLTFRPNNPVTRAELAQMLVDVFDLQATEEDKAIPAIDGDETVMPPLDGADTSGEEANGEYHGGEDIYDESTPKEAKPEALALAFKDLGLPGYAWADEAITVLAKLGLSHGNGEGYYQPQRAVTRAECAAFLDRILTMLEQEVKEDDAALDEAGPEIITGK
ncbi:MAG: S-layer homology domain-containing protein [Clostridiales bacterium]|nr:S-layer homology domain-containing protein [Clostridiales bacterium]